MANYFRKLRFNIGMLFTNLNEFSNNLNILLDDTLMRPIRYIYYGLYNLYDWFPIIFHDRNWDQYYINKILHKKLKNMMIHIDVHQNHTTYKQDVKTLNFCVKRLDELLENDFCKTIMLKHNKIYGELEIGSSPNFDKQGQIISYTMNFNRANVKTENDQIIENTRFMYIMGLQQRRRTRCLNLLHDCMKKI